MFLFCRTGATVLSEEGDQNRKDSRDREEEGEEEQEIESP